MCVCVCVCVCVCPLPCTSVCACPPDAAYLSPDGWPVLQLTAWVPLVSATRLNGCMQVMPGMRRFERIGPHTGCAGNTWYLDLSEEAMRREFGVRGCVAACECVTV